MRLQKFLAQCGVASRRAAEKLILEGRVRVNGAIVQKLGTSVDESDRVAVDGKLIQPVARKVYLIMNKPLSVVTTLSDPQGRRTVRDLLPKGTPRVVPVGRLDYDTSGLLLLTNDGELVNRLTHPRYGVQKTYRVVIRGQLQTSDAERLRRGLHLEYGRTAPAALRVVKKTADRTIADLTIHEGRNRQVRRMFEALGYPTMSLERRNFGPLRLGSLAPGAVRGASEREISALRRI